MPFAIGKTRGVDLDWSASSSSPVTGTVWDGAAPDDIHRAALYFTEPHEHRWFEAYTPTLESCQLASEPNLAVFPLLDPEAERLTLAASVGSALSFPTMGSGSRQKHRRSRPAVYDLLAPGGSFQTKTWPLC